MTVYVDASALLKLYLDETDSEAASELLRVDSSWVSACVTVVEVRRNFARLLGPEDVEQAQNAFREDWAEVTSLTIDDNAADRAAALSEETGVKSLDALHLEAAERAGAAEGFLPIVTFDRRLADAARSLGWAVLP